MSLSSRADGSAWSGATSNKTKRIKSRHVEFLSLLSPDPKVWIFVMDLWSAWLIKMVFDLIFRRQLSLLELRGEAGAAHHRAAVGRQRRDLEEAVRSRHQNQGRKLSPSTLGFSLGPLSNLACFWKVRPLPKNSLLDENGNGVIQVPKLCQKWNELRNQGFPPRQS